MAFDQNITYRVNVDDSNFQARLTQMRASMDSAFGGMGGMGMTGMYGMMNTIYGGAGGMGGMGNIADFGTQIRPVTYTPPAIAMQPHFGMFQVQQTLSQAGLGAMGPIGIGLSQTMTNYRAGGLGGILRGPSGLPENISMTEYMAMSARGFADRVGDAAAIGAVTAASTAAQLGAGAIGSVIGAAPFASGGFMAGVGGLIGGVAGGMAVSAYAGAVTDMMAENRAVQSQLAAGSFRFFTSGATGDVDPLTGRGMSRRARASVATSIQNMEMNDLRYSMDEYKQVLEGGMQFDLFSGTHDVEDFKNKFKGLVETLKTVTTTLHTSLKEGLEVVRGFRDMGVTDPSEVSRLVLSSEARGRASGRTGMEMLAIGQAGAEIFRGTGITMERGFELNQMNVTTVRSMLNAGTLSREMIMQAGGENALAQQMTAGALSAFQTAQGRAAMMANFNMGTGAMNPNLLPNLMGGDIMQQIAGAARMGPAALLTFQARQEDLISKMSPQAMQTFGLSLDVGMGRELMKAAPGLGAEDAVRVAAQRRGLSKPQVEAEVALMTQNPDTMLADQQAAIDAVRTQAAGEDIRNRANIFKQASNFLRRTFVAAPAQAATGLSTAVGEAVENASLRLTGAALVDQGIVNKESVAATRVIGPESGTAVDISGGLALPWGQRAEARAFLNEMYGRGRAMTFKNKAEAEEYARTHGNIVIGTNDSGDIIGMRQSQLGDMLKNAQSWQSNQSERDEAGKAKLSDEIGGNIQGDMSAAQVMEKIGGIAPRDLQLSDEDFTKKYKHSKGYYTALANRYMETYHGAETTRGALAELSSGSHIGAVSAATAQSAAEDAQKAANQILNMGFVSKLPSQEREFLLAKPGNIPLLFKAAAGDTAARGELARLAPTGMAAALSAAAKPDQGTSELVSRIEKDIRVAASFEQTAGATAGTSQVVGDVSKDTSQNLDRMSRELIANYQVLIGLQKQLNDLQGKK